MKILIIGSSTGGPRILFDIFNNIPKFPLSIIIVQHIPNSTTPRLARRLSQLCEYDVIIPESGYKLKPGSLYITPGDYHLTLVNNEIISLETTEKVNFVRPSIDVTMFSLKKISDSQLSGIILSGMGCDGAEGMVYLKSLGGITMVQDPETCVIKSMPQAALNTNKIDRILTPSEIHEYLKKLG
jgi:two-component system, chemotaxis family, protein-glutamate methylesterase/glutaminase